MSKAGRRQADAQMPVKIFSRDYLDLDDLDDLDDLEDLDDLNHPDHLNMALMTLTYDNFTFPGKVVIQCEHINKADFTAASGFKAMVEDFEGREQPVKIKLAQSDFCIPISYQTFPCLVRIPSSFSLQDQTLTLTDSGVLAEPRAKADNYNEVGCWTVLQSDHLPKSDCQGSRSEVNLQNLMKYEMKC